MLPFYNKYVWVWVAGGVELVKIKKKYFNCIINYGFILFRNNKKF